MLLILLPVALGDHQGVGVGIGEGQVWTQAAPELGAPLARLPHETERPVAATCHPCQKGPVVLGKAHAQALLALGELGVRQRWPPVRLGFLGHLEQPADELELRRGRFGLGARELGDPGADPPQAGHQVIVVRGLTHRAMVTGCAAGASASLRRDGNQGRWIGTVVVLSLTQAMATP